MLFSLKRYWIIGLMLALATAFAGALPLVATAQEPEKPAADEPAADPYAVPDGSAADLVEFIQGILTTRPPNAEARQKAIAAMSTAADKILAAKPNESEARMAVEIKTMFSESAEELEKIAADLKKTGFPKLARKVRGNVITARVREIPRKKPEDQAKAAAKQIEAFKSYLAEEAIQQEDLRMVMAIGSVLERVASSAVAAKAYADFGKILAKSEDPAVANMAETLAGVGRRLGLVGKPMKVEGTMLGGEKFDWSSLKGKVVLVDFWATWCGPCVAEVPNMKRSYEAYHDKGFEIVGISLDRGLEPLKKFIEDREIPWPIIYDEENPSPTPSFYGVIAVPTMILVGADGNVISTEARGRILDRELEKIFGPIEPKNEDAPAEEEGDK